MKEWVRVTDASQLTVGDQVRYGKFVREGIDFGDSSPRWVSKIDEDGRIHTSEDSTCNTMATTDLMDRAKWGIVEVLRTVEDKIVMPPPRKDEGPSHKYPCGALIELQIYDGSPYQGMRLYVTGHFFDWEKKPSYRLGSKGQSQNCYAEFGEETLNLIKLPC